MSAEKDFDSAFAEIYPPHDPNSVLNPDGVYVPTSPGIQPTSPGRNPDEVYVPPLTLHPRSPSQGGGSNKRTIYLDIKNKNEEDSKSSEFSLLSEYVGLNHQSNSLEYVSKS